MAKGQMLGAAGADASITVDLLAAACWCISEEAAEPCDVRCVTQQSSRPRSVPAGDLEDVIGRAETIEGCEQLMPDEY
jgi:hypothetical protein